MNTKVYVYSLTCDGLKNPLGISCDDIRLQWKIGGDIHNLKQKQFMIQIAEEKSFESGSIITEVCSRSEKQYFYQKKKLKEKAEYFWRIRLNVEYEDEKGKKTVWLDWSDMAWFETGLLDENSWKGKWIEADDNFYKDAEQLCRKFWKDDISKNPLFIHKKDQGLRRNPYFQRCFEINEKITKGRVYITAHGLYELYLNEERVGDYAIAPDFTAYDKSIYYQTFDVTDKLRWGENKFTVILGDGWYAGHAQGILGFNHLYGERPALLMQAEINYEDGSVEAIATDTRFTAATGQLLYADLFMGEYLDCCQVSRSYGTVSREYDKSVLMPQKAEGIKEITVLDAEEVKKIGDHEYIIDFGRVIAGRERIEFLGEENSEIKIEFSERVEEQGCGDLMELIPVFPYHHQTDYIRIGNEKRFLYEPKFSFQGFRYIKVSGVRKPLAKEQCKAVVLQSAIRDTISFRCSNPKVNKLVENVQWSQRGNMISIPTDCPQRERGGFTGDAQIFCTTAAWNQNVEMFFRRWLEQCRLEQMDRGQIPIVVPYTEAYSINEPNPGWTSTGWGDAIVFIPWDLYQAYGDIRILEENYEAMEKWMQYAKCCAEDIMPERYYLDCDERMWHRYLWNAGYHWGDWLMPGLSAEEGVMLTKEITASLFYYREVCTMEEICCALHKADQMKHYAELKNLIKRSFHRVYITEEKQLLQEFQGAYVMALQFGIVDGDMESAFAERLNEMVAAAGYHLQTGFLSTPYLLDVLWDYGYKETVYKVFYQEERPSWMYAVKQGATTIWEEWDGDDITAAGCTKGSSFNHYAYGCISDFIFRKIGGVIREKPGFKRIRIAPELRQGITFSELEYETPYGKLEVKWKQEENTGKKLTVKIPHNTAAVIMTAEGEKTVGSGFWEF